MENSKFTDEQREKAIELLEDDGDVTIMFLGEFMTAYEPWQVALMVTQSKLKLDKEYVRVGDYYADTHEADDMYSLLSDDEIEEALDELQ